MEPSSLYAPERKNWRGKETWVYSCSARSAVKHDSRRPLPPFTLGSGMQSHSKRPSRPPLLGFVTLTFLKVASDTGCIQQPVSADYAPARSPALPYRPNLLKRWCRAAFTGLQTVHPNWFLDQKWYNSQLGVGLTSNRCP